MMGWSLVFLIIALIAGAIGFGGIASGSVGLAQILFILFLSLFIITALVRLLRP